MTPRPDTVLWLSGDRQLVLGPTERLDGRHGNEADGPWCAGLFDSDGNWMATIATAPAMAELMAVVGPTIPHLIDGAHRHAKHYREPGNEADFIGGVLADPLTIDYHASRSPY